MPLSAQPCRGIILKSAISIKFSFADDYVALRPGSTLTAHNFCELLFRPYSLLAFYNTLIPILTTRRSVCKEELYEFNPEALIPN